MAPIPFPLRQLGRFLAHVLRRCNEDRCLQIASSLTFTTLLAPVPLDTLTLPLMAAFPIFSGLGEHIHAFLLANMLPEKAGKVVTGYIEQFSGQAGQLTALGTAVLAVTAFLMMFTIERAFNSIWRVSRPRPVAQRILIYWATLTLGPVLIGASLWIYFSWVVIVIGALIAALAPDFSVLRDTAGRASGTGFGDVLAILLVLARAQQGPGLLELRKIAQHASLTVDQTELLLERLVARGWVARSSGERYAMVFDKERLLVADVYREFVLNGEAPAAEERSEALKQLLEQFAARADETLN